MLKRFMDVVKDEEGATMVEYALLVAVIAIVALVGAGPLGTAIKDKFTAAGTTVTTGVP